MPGWLEEIDLQSTILEQFPHVAHAWRNHYERLHLHTPKGGSGLPYFNMPASYPKYPSRDQVIEYLEAYARTLKQQPLFNKEVTSVRRDGDQWIVATTDTTYNSKNVIIATGYTRKPLQPTWKGMDSYKGTIIHTSKYSNGQPYSGKRVLVGGLWKFSMRDSHLPS